MKFWFAVLFLILTFQSFGQYGNEWINYSQQYYYFPITEEGIFRISKQELTDAGLDINNIDPRSIQVFGRGEEIPLYIEGESDGSFDDSDFIEFYGKSNDGYFDTQLYSTPDDQVNPHFSSFNDTIMYYLSWSSSINNERLQVVSDVNTSGQSPENYFWKTHITNYGLETQYHFGPRSSVNTELADFGRGEGFVSRRKTKGQGKSSTVDLGVIYTGGGLTASFNTKLAGQSNDNSVNGDHKTSVTIGSFEVLDTIYESNNMVSFSTEITSLALSSSTSVVFQSDASHVSNVDSWSVGYFDLTYPHQDEFAAFTELALLLDDGLNDKAYLKLNGYNNLGESSLFYDLTNKKKILVQNNGSPYVLVSNSGGRKECYLSNEGLIKSVPFIKGVASQGGQNTFTDYSTLNHDFIIISHKDFLTSAYDYQNYRNSTGYNVVVVEIEEIYHQFGHGIFRHPYSIRQFCRQAEDTWTLEPAFLLIIGKGVFDNGSYSISAITRYNIGHNYVPTYGSPGSDQLFTAGLDSNNPSDYKPSMATGRLACTNTGQVDDYLNKLQLLEAQEPDEWMKNILHFAGGGSESESNQFRDFLDDMKVVVEDTLYGGDVKTFVKFNTEPMSVDVGDSLRTLIEGGVSIMNFMGHASGANFDYAIDAPASYNNVGRNPLMMGVSCNVGNMYGRNTVSGIENYVNAIDKGAIGFIASSTASVASYGNLLISNLYQELSYGSYNQPIGVIMSEAIDNIQSSNTLTRNTCMTMNLHGDPAFNPGGHPKPDYTVYTDATNISPSIYTVPSIVTSQVDSFELAIELTNIGMAMDTSFWLSVTRNFPGLGISDTTYLVQIDQLYFKDTAFVKMPVDFINGVGLNNFTVRLDVLEEVSELDDVINNNVVNYPVYIQSGDLVPVYPYEYAVISDPVTKLIASTGDVLAPQLTYVFQLDTNDQFSSPTHFLQYQVSQSGGVVEWNPLNDPALMSVLSSATDSMVFFWRVSLDSSLTDDGLFNWRESSFQYIDGKTGWGQDHFHQFKRNHHDFLNYQYTERNWTYFDTPTSLRVKTSNLSGNNIWEVGYWVDNIQRHSGVYANGSGNSSWIHIGIMDGSSLESWSTFDYDFNQNNVSGTGMPITPNYNTNVFMFANNQHDDMLDLLDSANNGDYIVWFTRWNNSMRNWSSDMKLSLSSYGMDTNVVNSLSNIYHPLIFVAKKGDPSSGYTIKSDGAWHPGHTQLDTTLASAYTQGEIISTVVGPSSNWGSLHWKSEKVLTDGLNEDSLNIEIIGIDISGNEISLFDTVADAADIIDLYNYIDASIYPYLKLNAFMVDTFNNTPPQMDYWHVLFDEMPEAALNPQIAMVIPTESSMEGEDYSFSYAVENVSNTDMDSLQIKYWLIDEDNNVHTNVFTLHDSLRAGEYMIDTVEINTLNAVGVNQIWLEVNPYDGPIPWQLERYHFNNIANWEFAVGGDKINPILDVTFDGIHILNGDIISPNPNVLIRLDDENEYLALNDTTLFEVYIKYPNDISITPTRTYFSTSENLNNMLFTPATLPDNKATIELNPSLTQNGEYTLLVRAKDRSANISGKGEDGVYDYKIDFEVINESTITSILNYPNPFSTSTQFVFTLTGSVIPTEFKIQIMTITGKVVKEITRDEIGSINIGRNVTEYRWDGTDSFGDRLANGVYLYRVITGIDGNAIDHQETDADQYFQKGFGKLYIMR